MLIAIFDHHLQTIKDVMLTLIIWGMLKLMILNEKDKFLPGVPGPPTNL